MQGHNELQECILGKKKKRKEGKKKETEELNFKIDI